MPPAPTNPRTLRIILSHVAKRLKLHTSVTLTQSFRVPLYPIHPLRVINQEIHQTILIASQLAWRLKKAAARQAVIVRRLDSTVSPTPLQVTDQHSPIFRHACRESNCNTAGTVLIPPVLMAILITPLQGNLLIDFDLLQETQTRRSLCLEHSRSARDEHILAKDERVAAIV